MRVVRRTQESIEAWLLNPAPGSKTAAARDFGIDLTLLIERLRRTPEERLREFQGFIDFREAVRGEQGQRMTNIEKALVALVRDEVAFVVVGGVAASLHGSSLATFDLEICYSREPGSLGRLAAALAPFNPRLRDLPVALPFVWDTSRLRNRFNFTLATDVGGVNLLAEVAGVGDFATAMRSSVFKELCGLRIAVLSLDALISAKRAAGRPKDLLVVPELESLRESASEPQDD
jgi:hypothetical protein